MWCIWEISEIIVDIGVAVCGTIMETMFTACEFDANINQFFCSYVFTLMRNV